MLKCWILFICLFFCTGVSSAQQVKVLTLDQLDRRIEMGKDTVYVINFWATWCGPCVAELPNFEKLQATYKSRPLKVLLISLDFKSKLEKDVKPFVKKRGLKSEVFWLNEPNEQQYIDRVSKTWSGALPATLVINKKRKIRKFYEKEFTYAELDKIYQTLK
jgi:thiol-disulfide isomerase/thioredoxin